MVVKISNLLLKMKSYFLHEIPRLFFSIINAKLNNGILDGACYIWVQIV